MSYSRKLPLRWLGLLTALGICAAASAAAVPDLPVVEVPAAAVEMDFLAVMISGDGGWADLDQHLSAVLSARGVPVVGLNSLKYFWHARSPEETAQDVSRIIEHYTAAWHKPRVLLIGYSFGADVMPAVFNRLEAESRARVASISLLGLGPDATFEVTVGEWLPGAAKKGAPVLPEIAGFGATPALCIDGAGEKNTMCPELKQLGIEVRQIGAGHHFSGLAGDIADAILAVAFHPPGPKPVYSVPPSMNKPVPRKQSE